MQGTVENGGARRSILGNFKVADERRRVDEFLTDARLKSDRRDGILRHLESDRTEALSELAGIISDLLRAGEYELLRRHGLQYPASANFKEFKGSRAHEVADPWGPLLPEPPRLGNKWDLLGLEVDLPFGVPASPITSTPAWIEYFSRNGFNFQTWRTVRSGHHAGFIDPPHHILFEQLPVAPERLDDLIRISLGGAEPNYEPELASSLNSMGIPSWEPEQWKAQYAIAQGLLHHDGQQLALSVIGTGGSRKELVDDWTEVCRHASDTAARVVELNLSYAGVPEDVARGSIPRVPCNYPDLAEEICEAAITALGDPEVVVVAKLGYLPTYELRNLVTRLVPLVDAIAGINGVPVDAQWSDGAPVFADPSRRGAIAGAAIRECAQQFVETVASQRIELGTYFAIIGMGGVTHSDHAIGLRELGADVVQSATGSFLNPYLALDLYQRSDEFGLVPGDRAEFLERITKLSNEKTIERTPRFVPRAILKSAGLA